MQKVSFQDKEVQTLTVQMEKKKEQVDVRVRSTLGTALTVHIEEAESARGVLIRQCRVFGNRKKC